MDVDISDEVYFPFSARVEQNPPAILQLLDSKIGIYHDEEAIWKQGDDEASTIEVFPLPLLLPGTEGTLF
jgi:hypothetical protein